MGNYKELYATMNRWRIDFYFFFFLSITSLTFSDLKKLIC